MSERNSFDVNLHPEDLAEYDQWLDEREQDLLDALEDYDDGQPSEYDEWQDVYDGDDWNHGQYDDCPW